MKNYFTKEDEKLKWKEGKTTSLLKTVVCEVTSHHNTAQNGISGDYIIMNAPDWVIVIPEKDNNFLMVKQWRHGEQSLSVEFPGGVIDKNEQPETAAVRELEEETGYSGIILSDYKSSNLPVCAGTGSESTALIPVLV